MQSSALRIIHSTITAQRLISVISGLFVLVLSGLITRKIVPASKNWLMLVMPLLLLTDYPFMAATRIARPEIVVITLTLLSWALYLYHRPNSVWTSFCFGILFGLPALAHPLGIVAITIVPIDWFWNQDKKPSPLVIAAYLVGSILPLAIWLIIIRHDWMLMYTQYLLAASRKSQEPPWLLYTLINHMYGNYFALFTQVVGLFWLGFWIVKYKYHHCLTLFSSTVLFFVGVTFGRMFWYIPVFSVLYYLFLIKIYATVKELKKTATIFIIASIVVNFWLSWQRIDGYAVPPKAYSEYCEAITKNVPDHTTVLLFATPDPYYCFENRANILREFPVLKMNPTDLEKILDNTDYVVAQYTQNDILLGDYLNDYLVEASASSVLVGDSSNSYLTYIFKLKTPPGLDSR